MVESENDEVGAKAYTKESDIYAFAYICFEVSFLLILYFLDLMLDNLRSAHKKNLGGRLRVDIQSCCKPFLERDQNGLKHITLPMIFGLSSNGAGLKIPKIARKSTKWSRNSLASIQRSSFPKHRKDTNPSSARTCTESIYLQNCQYFTAARRHQREKEGLRSESRHRVPLLQISFRSARSVFMLFVQQSLSHTYQFADAVTLYIQHKYT